MEMDGTHQVHWHVGAMQIRRGIACRSVWEEALVHVHVTGLRSVVDSIACNYLLNRWPEFAARNGVILPPRRKIALGQSCDGLRLDDLLCSATDGYALLYSEFPATRSSPYPHAHLFFPPRPCSFKVCKDEKEESCFHFASAQSEVSMQSPDTLSHVLNVRSSFR